MQSSAMRPVVRCLVILLWISACASDSTGITEEKIVGTYTLISAADQPLPFDWPPGECLLRTTGGELSIVKTPQALLYDQRVNTEYDCGGRGGQGLWIGQSGTGIVELGRDSVYFLPAGGSVRAPGLLRNDTLRRLYTSDPDLTFVRLR
jgi:hypothetical protein